MNTPLIISLNGEGMLSSEIVFSGHVAFIDNQPAGIELDHRIGSIGFELMQSLLLFISLYRGLLFRRMGGIGLKILFLPDIKSTRFGPGCSMPGVNYQHGGVEVLEEINQKKAPNWSSVWNPTN